MKTILSTLAFAAAVAAHGYVDNATIGGQTYTVGFNDSMYYRTAQLTMSPVLPALPGSLHEPYRKAL